MRITGTEEEIAWVRKLLSPDCDGCPAHAECVQYLAEDGAEDVINGSGKSCSDFLSPIISYEIVTQ